MIHLLVLRAYLEATEIMTRGIWPAKCCPCGVESHWKLYNQC